MLKNRQLWNALWVLFIICATLIGASALVICGLVYLSRGLLEALIPHTGLPAAYALTGLGCAMLLALLGLTFKRQISVKADASPVAQGTGSVTGENPTLDPALRIARAMIRRYPLEAAGLALLAGYAVEDRDMRALLLKSGRTYVENKAGGAMENKAGGGEQSRQRH